MLLTYTGNRYVVVLGLVIQYLSCEGTFPGQVSPSVIISYSNTDGVVIGRRGRSSRPPRHPQVSCEHTTLLEDTSLMPKIYSFILFHTGR